MFYHEAAYDAYMTGFCFAQILKFVERRDDKGKKPKGSGKQKKLAKKENEGEDDAEEEQKAEGG